MNIKTIAIAAALGASYLQVPAGISPGASIIPERATAVYPTPDSRVDLGPNASPLGLQQISILFREEVTVNPHCAEKACIYLEGEDTPLQTVGINGASVDLTQSKMGSVLFPNTCTANGLYRVTIPEGFWILGAHTSNLSGAFDLYYEILMPQRIWPTDRVVSELKEFRLEFPGYSEARLLDARKIEFFRHGSTRTYPLSISEGKNPDGSTSNYILITLNEAVGEQGDYSLFVKKGAAEGVSYGVDAENPDQTSETTDTNIEALYRYTVSQISAPAIVPAEGTVESFVPFELTVPEGAEFWFVNDKAVSFIYPVYPDGTLAPDAAYLLTARKDDYADKIALTITEDGQQMTDVTPPPGSYALQLASGLFSGSWNGEFINSAPFVYYYQAVENPNGVKATPSSSTVPVGKRGIFTIDGRKLRDGQEEANLPEGTYIIDGQKKYIKR